MTKPTIGVDISKDHLDAHRWPDGESCRVSNDAIGHKALIRWIGGAVGCVAFEATGGYHAALEKALHRAGLPVAKLNPTRVRRFAQAIGTQAKTDSVDAALIARMAAMLEPVHDAPRPQTLVDLQEFQLVRAALIRDRTAARNRTGRLTLALLKRQHARTLKAIERDLAEIDAAIAALIAGDALLARRAAILCSIPGVSIVTAAAILAGMPEIGAVEPGAAASLAGVAPFSRESGRWKGAAKIGGGRAGLRRALYMPALTAARFNSDLKALYERLRAKGKPAKVALTAVMRKLVILANTLIRDDRFWESRA